MSYLVKTTFYELSEMVDELDVNGRIIFSTEDPDDLRYYNLQPCKYNIVYKTRLLFESDYVIVVGLLNGNCTIAKDINILSGGDVCNEESRIDGIKSFLEEYYNNHMQKNKHGAVYIVVN